MSSIQKNVGCQSIHFDLLDIDKWMLHSDSCKSLSYKWYGKVLGLRSNKPLVCWIKRCLHRFFDRILLREIFSEYDIIDFHYYSSIYFPLIPLAKSLGKKVKITLWGSDLLRATDEEKTEQVKGYEIADLIQVATPFMSDALCSVFPKFKYKVCILPFGNQSLDDFNLHWDDSVDDSFLAHYDKNKKMVVCGYNGSSGQRHLEMIKMLNELPNEIQKQIYVVFPMTYGAEPSYVNKVSEALSNNYYSYDVLLNRLDSKQLFDLRRLTDIAINIQITDAFSGSIQEHIFCENVLLVGEWLPYSMLKDAGIFYKITSLDNLSSSFVDVFYNYETYRKKCFNNKMLMYGLTSWAGLKDKWRAMYISIKESSK